MQHTLNSHTVYQHMNQCNMNHWCTVVENPGGILLWTRNTFSCSWVGGHKWYWFFCCWDPIFAAENVLAGHSPPSLLICYISTTFHYSCQL